jgi:hypothetical protein
MGNRNPNEAHPIIFDKNQSCDFDIYFDILGHKQRRSCQNGVVDVTEGDAHGHDASS